MQNKPKILIAGGMGYIGSHTVVELLSQGYQAIIIDNLSNSAHSVLPNIEAIAGQAVLFEHVDLADAVATELCFARHKDAVGVIHFAALKAVGESVQQPNLYYQNNINSLVNVLREMAKHRIPNLIFSSSCTVYGRPDVLPVNESTPMQPAQSPYGYTKQIGERIINDNTSINPQLSAISLRYFNPIGAHSSALIGELPIGVPNNLLPYITQTASGVREQLSVFGDDYDTPDGTAIRDYIHVVDLAKAHAVAMERLINKQNKTPHEHFNLGTGNGMSVLEVIHSFEKMSGQKLNYRIAPRREGDIDCIFADTTLAEQELGWKAALGIDEMTLSAWNWEKRLRGIV